MANTGGPLTGPGRHKSFSVIVFVPALINLLPLSCCVPFAGSTCRLRHVIDCFVGLLYERVSKAAHEDSVVVRVAWMDFVDDSHGSFDVMAIIFGEQETALAPFDFKFRVLVDSFGQLVKIDGHLLGFDVGFWLQSHGQGHGLLPRGRVSFFRDFASPELKSRALVFLQKVITLSLGEFLVELKSLPVLLELDKIVG